MVDPRGRDATGLAIADALARDSRPAEGQSLGASDDVRDTLLPRLIGRARALAEQRIPGVVEGARRDVHARLQHEAIRLRELQKVNRTVRDEEIALLLEQEAALDRALGDARLRLDAVRLIYRGR